MNSTTNLLLLIIVLILLFGAGVVLKGAFIYFGILFFIILLGIIVGFPIYLKDVIKGKNEKKEWEKHKEIHKKMGVDTSKAYSAFELALSGCKICLHQSDPIKLETYKKNKTSRELMRKNLGLPPL